MAIQHNVHGKTSPGNKEVHCKQTNILQTKAYSQNNVIHSYTLQTIQQEMAYNNIYFQQFTAWQLAATNSLQRPRDRWSLN